MAHPVHDLLMRWLGTEQYAFDERSCEYWPPGSWPQGQGDLRPDDSSDRDPE